MCLGIPGKILDVYEKNDLPMGKVEFGGISKEICLAYTPEAQLGEYVLVHVGFAISQIDEKEAEEIFSYLQQIGEAAELEEREAIEAAELEKRKVTEEATPNGKVAEDRS